ncbi:hypothetical protein [Streptomyces lancefieldiae]|uniref:Lipoprotein n=1 Tax=Streptomyces lancefieldiae TaxID=3075520 RepID=A0ABU3AVL4_9ACTN|nr:hypothetical protein [Streptomyces sp. DSM 40712]MDT0614232.1 hypothetical protein [Streptomyces sp. DSM 40712]
MNRATTATLSTLTLLSLAALTACGGDSGSNADSTAGKPEATTSVTTSASKQPSPAEHLAKTMVTTSEVEGLRVEKLDDEFLFAKSPDEVTTDKPVCTPLALAMNQLPLGTPEADLTRSVSGQIESERKSGTGFTYITLTSYGTGGAESALAGLKKAVEACGGGFTAKSKENESSYDSVTAEQPAAVAGDESLAFRATLTFRGATHTVHTQAVRGGDVVAVYFSVDGLAIANARPSDAKLSATVVKAQNAKLG